jgi:diguanylate cyclase (GGDEF)-like protein
LVYNAKTKARANHALTLNIGYTDSIDTDANPVVNACKLNSLMKYKKMYDSFTNKLKKSIYLSAIDSTTGVYNRSFFEDYIRNQEKRPSNSAILIIDIDKFKSINDKHGHSFADAMLKFVSSTIKRYIRSSDVIARYGGDEFIIFMENVSRKTVSEITHRIQRAVENSPFKDANCTVSVGACCIDVDGNLGIKEAISVADKFMYIAKNEGGNSVRICI